MSVQHNDRRSSLTERETNNDENRERSNSNASDSSLEMFRSFDDRDESIDFSNLQLDQFELQDSISSKIDFQAYITSLNLSGNKMESIPHCIRLFVNLKTLDVSENELTSFGPWVTALKSLTVLIASNNSLHDKSFPSDFGTSFSLSLKILSLGGNEFREIPQQVYDLVELRSLYFGGNRIQTIGKDIKKLVNLRVLYLGGNQLLEVPSEVGQLSNLQALSLCENRLSSLPASIARLRNLKSLALHKNLLTTLPQEIVKLRGLIELSLRDNPLIVRFIRDFPNNPPSLIELAGRCVKRNGIPFTRQQLPAQLIEYLSSAQYCVNPKCKGVYFDARVEHIKFVDFCGIYRLPLLQYLCSSQCTSNISIQASSSEDESDVPLSKMKRVLLG